MTLTKEQNTVIKIKISLNNINNSYRRLYFTDTYHTVLLLNYFTSNQDGLFLMLFVLITLEPLFNILYDTCKVEIKQYIIHIPQNCNTNKNEYNIMINYSN